MPDCDRKWDGEIRRPTDKITRRVEMRSQIHPSAQKARGQLFLPDSQTNNRGQTEFCASTPKPDHISCAIPATVNRAAGREHGVPSEDVQQDCPCTMKEDDEKRPRCMKLQDKLVGQEEQRPETNTSVQGTGALDPGGVLNLLSSDSPHATFIIHPPACCLARDG
ncbi:hypothetical protein EYF80_022348 [Liparis tanakae]|uniref:Uncharacterized protein n=1 Tax=Liparis tanakae TaxID=230148 RepID=A0A4Z2HQX3_9TELE|nr:hypothetical protein EYF80_022348 [Liparis tanakae]